MAAVNSSFVVCLVFATKIKFYTKCANLQETKLLAGNIFLSYNIRMIGQTASKQTIDRERHK